MTGLASRFTFECCGLKLHGGTQQSGKNDGELTCSGLQWAGRSKSGLVASRQTTKLDGSLGSSAMPVTVISELLNAEG